MFLLGRLLRDAGLFSSPSLKFDFRCQLSLDAAPKYDGSFSKIRVGPCCLRFRQLSFGAYGGGLPAWAKSTLKRKCRG